MGRGSYTAKDWEKLRTARSITSDASAENLFKNTKMLDKFNPKFIGMREARDNDEHPNSTPIAIGVDVTGSMGYLSESIIKNSLNELMKKLYASKVIPDPQLMFAAIGDLPFRSRSLNLISVSQSSFLSCGSKAEAEILLRTIPCSGIFLLITQILTA